MGQSRRKGSRKRAGRGNKSARSGFEQSLVGRSIQGMNEQQIVRLVVPGLPHNLVNTITTGVLASTLKFDPVVDVEDWTTRFLNTFEEYRLLGVKVVCMPTGGNAGATPPGVSKVWIDEKYLGVPGLGETTAKTTLTLQHSPAHRQQTVFRWRANDFGDRSFIAGVTSATNTAAFKVYTDNANYNAPVTAASLWLIQAFYELEFRGIEEQ